ncbi:uncharacterized mitochondrial protein-like protein [Tanacetum coccineum]
MSYREAVCDPLWQVAMAEELVALPQTQMWDLVPLPVGKRAISSRWVYKMKSKSDGSIERYKARLVVKGYAQEYSMDNEETFAPVVKIIKCWAYTFIIYVDDMIITGDDCVGIESLKLELAYRFAMKDLGLFCYFLGIEVASSPKGYLLSQSKYIGDLLDRARITYKMVEDIPINAKAKYTLTDGDPLLDPSLYQTIFQTLLFLSMSTLDLRAYCDSDWAGDVVSCKSTTGFCIFLRDSLISWKSKK